MTNSWKWDEYFLGICDRVAAHSKCRSRQIGAILVRDKVIISTGYNGPPRGFPECPERWQDGNDVLAYEAGALSNHSDACPRRVLGYGSGERLDLCPAVHAEVNCVASAARVGASVVNTALYMNAQIPCSRCLGVLIDAGVRTIVVTSLEPYDQLSRAIIHHSNLTIRDFFGEFYSHKGVINLPKETRDDTKA